MTVINAKPQLPPSFCRQTDSQVFTPDGNCCAGDCLTGNWFRHLFMNVTRITPSYKLAKCLCLVSLLLALGLAGAVHAQTLSDIGSTAPTPGPNDIYQFSTQGNQTAPDGLNYYTDNQTGHGTGEPGQTFTTGTNAAGYMLTSVAVRTGGLGSSTYNGISTPQPYYLHIYSISGSDSHVAPDLYVRQHHIQRRRLAEMERLVRAAVGQRHLCLFLSAKPVRPPVGSRWRWQRTP